MSPAAIGNPAVRRKQLMSTVTMVWAQAEGTQREKNKKKENVSTAE